VGASGSDGTGRTLSSVLSAVTGVHAHVPSPVRHPSNSSQWTSPSAAETSGSSVTGCTLVEITTRRGFEGSTAPSPV
jgi:hypothetical protein